MKKINILTEVGSMIGVGHFTRCLSLLQACSALGQTPLFWVDDVGTFAGHLPDFLKTKTVTIKHWLKKLPSEINQADLVVVDSYLAPLSQYQRIKASGAKLVVIDDFSRLPYPADVIVNGSIGAENFSFAPGTKTLLGPKYLPLRPAFWSSPSFEVRPKIKNVLVTLGGSDMHLLMPSITKALLSNFSFDLHLLVGPLFSPSEKQQLHRLSQKNQRIFLYEAVVPEKLPELMSQVDLAISAGGQTLYELASIGVPTIAIQIADNQSLNMVGWIKAEFIPGILTWHDKNLVTNLLKQVRILDSYTKRRNISIQGKKHCDGQGAIRLAKELLYDQKI